MCFLKWTGPVVSEVAKQKTEMLKPALFLAEGCLAAGFLMGSFPKDGGYTSGGCEPVTEMARCGSSHILGTGACGLVSLLLHRVKLVLVIGQETRGCNSLSHSVV